MNNLPVGYKKSQHTPSEKLKTHTMSHIDLSPYHERNQMSDKIWPLCSSFSEAHTRVAPTQTHYHNSTPITAQYVTQDQSQCRPKFPFPSGKAISTPIKKPFW